MGPIKTVTEAVAFVYFLRHKYGRDVIVARGARIGWQQSVDDLVERYPDDFIAFKAKRRLDGAAQPEE